MDIPLWASILLVLSFAAELLLPIVWKRRLAWSGFTIFLSSFASVNWFLVFPNIWGGVLLLSAVYRAINLLRVGEARLPQQHLRQAVVSSSRTIIVIQFLLGSVALFWDEYVSISLASFVASTALVQLIIAAVLCITVIVNIYLHRFRRSGQVLQDTKLPALTVAIPARNETDDLIACLESVLASNYPKLEVIVYDDCSQTKTSDIIRRYANDGVRFIKGEVPKENWLAKNQAYQALLEAASGNIVVFCGVDVRLKVDSLRQLVMQKREKRVDMVSVLPFRTAAPTGFFIQPLRYWWELAMPRFLMRQPPALTTLWIADKEAVLKFGGFNAVSQAIRPETFFAREFAKIKKYQFIIGGRALGIESVKRPASQLQTALRTRYPQLHRRPEAVFALSLMEAVLLFGPYVVIYLGLLGRVSGSVLAVSTLSGLLLIVSHTLIVVVSCPRAVAFAIVNFPLGVLVELGLVNESMRRYEFTEVIWRGRNICVPTLQTLRNLPKV